MMRRLVAPLVCLGIVVAGAAIAETYDVRDAIKRLKSRNVEDRYQWANELLPVYPAAAAIQTWDIAKAVRTVLDIVDWPDDPLPATLLAGRGLLDLPTALRLVHRPSNLHDVQRARDRLKGNPTMVAT